MGATANTKVMAGLKCILLGTELNAGYSKADDGQRIFVYQNASATNEGMKITEMISDVKRLLGLEDAATIPGLTKDTVNDKLAPLVKGPFDIDAIRVVLSTVYLKAFIPKEGKRTVEYALKVDVKMEGLIPADIQLVNIKEITLAIWNTDDEKMLKQMDILLP